jgi:hypothetical protein
MYIRITISSYTQSQHQYLDVTHTTSQRVRLPCPVINTAKLPKQHGVVRLDRDRTQPLRETINVIVIPSESVRDDVVSSRYRTRTFLCRRMSIGNWNPQLRSNIVYFDSNILDTLARRLHACTSQLELMPMSYSSSSTAQTLTPQPPGVVPQYPPVPPTDEGYPCPTRPNAGTNPARAVLRHGPGVRHRLPRYVGIIKWMSTSKWKKQFNPGLGLTLISGISGGSIKP